MLGTHRVQYLVLGTHRVQYLVLGTHRVQLLALGTQGTALGAGYTGYSTWCWVHRAQSLHVTVPSCQVCRVQCVLLGRQGTVLGAGVSRVRNQYQVLGAVPCVGYAGYPEEQRFEARVERHAGREREQPDDEVNCNGTRTRASNVASSRGNTHYRPWDSVCVSQCLDGCDGSHRGSCRKSRAG